MVAWGQIFKQVALLENNLLEKGVHETMGMAESNTNHFSTSISFLTSGQH